MSNEEKKDNNNEKENNINIFKEYINNCQDEVIKKIDINNNLKEKIPEDKLNELSTNIFKDSNEELEKIKILEILNNLQNNNNEKEEFKVENNNDNNILGDLNSNNNLDLVLPSNKIKLPVLEFKPNPHKNKIYSEDIKNQQKKTNNLDNILNNNNNFLNKNNDKQNKIFEKINSFKNEFFYPKNSMTEEKKTNTKSYYSITNKNPSNNNINNDFKKRAEKLQYLDHNKKVDLRDSNQRNEYVNDIKGKIQNFSNNKKEKENNYKNIKSPFDDINEMLESFKNKRNKENKNEENKQE